MKVLLNGTGADIHTLGNLLVRKPLHLSQQVNFTALWWQRSYGLTVFTQRLLCFRFTFGRRSDLHGIPFGHTLINIRGNLGRFSVEFVQGYVFSHCEQQCFGAGDFFATVFQIKHL